MSAQVIGAPRVLRLLGRHVVDGPHVHAALGQPAGAAFAWPNGLGCLDDPRQPEVEHADRALGIEHQVRRLDVAMDDPFGVRRLQPARRLDQEVDGLDDRQRPALADDAGRDRVLRRTPSPGNGRPDPRRRQGAATMLGCFKRPAASTSRLNRRTAVRSRANEGGRILSATIRSSRRCRALKTTPMPPAPSLSRIR